MEAALVAALVGAGLLAALGASRAAVRRGREVALVAELKTLRAGIVWYEAAYRQRPASLEVLVQARMQRMREDRPPAVGARGLVDTFGHAYAYDPGTGAVHSTTPGYETW